MKTSTSSETCKRKPKRVRRRSSASIYIQFIRDDRLFGLEVGAATRQLELIEATHDCVAVRSNARLLLTGIEQGREIFDRYPLISERGKREQSPPIYIHDAILSEIAIAIKAAYRAIGGYDD